MSEESTRSTRPYTKINVGDIEYEHVPTVWDIKSEALITARAWRDERCSSCMYARVFGSGGRFDSVQTQCYRNAGNPVIVGRSEDDVQRACAEWEKL